MSKNEEETIEGENEATKTKISPKKCHSQQMGEETALTKETIATKAHWISNSDDSDGNNDNLPSTVSTTGT